MKKRGTGERFAPAGMAGAPKRPVPKRRRGQRVSDEELRRMFTMKLPSHDYAEPGTYFVTQTTHEQCCLFGEIRDGLMHPNTLGSIVVDCWHDLPKHHENLALDAFALMPNHVHGILILHEQARQSLSHVMLSGFIYRSAKAINEAMNRRGHRVWGGGDGGAGSYFAKRIRDVQSLTRIRRYIATDPLNWALDPLNPARAGLDPAGRA